MIRLKNYTLETLNSLGPGAFVEVLGGVFEHSPWVASKAYASAPFRSLQHLHDTMTGVMRRASREEQLALLRAHPDLAGKLGMSASSVKEQQRAGLTGLTEGEYRAFNLWNEKYKKRFGFPFILAVRNHDKLSILAAMQARSEHETEEELETALQEVAKIAGFRLAEIIEE